MTLVDTGPLVALFDPRDRLHRRCRSVLEGIEEPLGTTVPVLTEAFHILTPESRGSAGLRDLVLHRGLSVFFLDASALARAFELMEQYSDHPMDLADASIVAAAERLRTRKVFTADHSDFSTYRVRLGHRQYPVEIVS